MAKRALKDAGILGVSAVDKTITGISTTNPKVKTTPGRPRRHDSRWAVKTPESDAGAMIFRIEGGKVVHMSSTSEKLERALEPCVP